MLTNAEVVTLTEAGLPVAVTLAKIAATNTDFDTRVEQLLPLLEMEVDAGALMAMLATGSRSDEAGSREHRPPCGTPIAHQLPFGYPWTFRLHAHRQRTAHGNAQDRQRPGHHEANLEVHHANATNS